MLTSPVLLRLQSSMMEPACFLISKRCGLTSSCFSRRLFRKKDRQPVLKSKYKSSDHGKELRGRNRKHHKGFENKQREGEGPMYVPGELDDQPGPSKKLHSK